MTSEPLMKGLQLALRAGVAAGLALAIALLIKLENPIYVFIAAVITTDLAPSKSRDLGLRRILATFVGAACGALLTSLLPPGPVAVGIGVAVAMFASFLLLGQEGARISGFICGLILLDHSVHPWLDAYHRLIETALGVVVALAVSYVPKLIAVDTPGRQEGQPGDKGLK